jgi:hypothetical protein
MLRQVDVAEVIHVGGSVCPLPCPNTIASGICPRVHVPIAQVGHGPSAEVRHGVVREVSTIGKGLLRSGSGADDGIVGMSRTSEGEDDQTGRTQRPRAIPGVKVLWCSR